MSNVPAQSNGDSSNFGMMGLRGWYATIGNGTAMLLVGALVMLMWWSSESRSKEDLRVFRETNDRQWQVIAEGHTTVAKMADSLKELADEVRELNRRQRRAKGGEEEAAKPAIQANEGKP